ncbi:hypothetical protein Tco_0921420, partial [Tanacetum coccineum]
NVVEKSILPMLLKESLKSLGGLVLLSFVGKLFLRHIFELSLELLLARALLAEMNFWTQIKADIRWRIWVRSLLTRIENIGSNLGHEKEEDAHEFLRYVVDAQQSVFIREAG